MKFALRNIKHLLHYIRHRKADTHRLAALTSITEDLETKWKIGQNAKRISRGR